MSLRKNVISNFILTASTILFPLITFPYITRTLSNVNIGKIFFIDAFTQYFIIFSSIGIPFYGVREIAKIKNDNQAKSNLVIELVFLQFSLAVFFAFVFILLNFYFPSLKGYDKLVEIGCISVIFSSFLIEWFYQGIETFTYITIRSLIIKILSVIVILLIVKKDEDFTKYYWILSILIVANSILNFFNFLKNHYLPYNGRYLLKRHIKPLMILFSINVSVSIYTVFDTIILGMFTNPENVSYYNVPLKLVKMYWMVVSGIGAVMIPRMSALFVANDIDMIKSLMSKSFSIMFLLTIPFAVYCFVFPKEILYVISGNKYLYAVNGLRILSIVPLIIGVCNVLGVQYLLPIGKESKILIATGFGLVISLILNFMLIPYLKFIGSCIACVAAELAVCIYICIAAGKTTKIVLDYKLIFLILISLFLTIFLTLLISKYLHDLLLLISSLICYACVLWFLQTFIFKNPVLDSFIRFKKAG
jgi:O-antigen/teichoic acid export membrane protein